MGTNQDPPRRPDPALGPAAFFTADHRRCDAGWERVEIAAEAGDADEVGRAFRAFDTAVRLHLDLEEELLFPALEEATGMHGVGPTQVMRMEHAQMRGLLATMGRAATAGDVDGLMDHGDTLLMLVQQHNLKEEGMLYKMAERFLGGERWAQLARAIAARYDPGE